MELKASREGFGEALIQLGETNPKVVVLTADLTESTRCAEFKKRFPDRFFQFGVAEQNMMSAAAGLSLAGWIPFVCSYGVFTAGRCWEQVRQSVCHSNCNVKILGAHAGLSAGPDGASHQGTEDLALMRVLPGMTIFCPCDSIEAKKVTLKAAEIIGPVYIRVGRYPVPTFSFDVTPFSWEVSCLIQPSTTKADVVIIACGTEVSLSMTASYQLKLEGIDASVLNCHVIKPLDEKGILDHVRLTGCVVVAEEHQQIGGLGEAICSLLSRNFPVPIELVGIKDKFGESGPPSELLKHYELDSSAIKNAVKNVIERKRAWKTLRS